MSKWKTILTNASTPKTDAQRRKEFEAWRKLFARLDRVPKEKYPKPAEKVEKKK